MLFSTLSALFVGIAAVLAHESHPICAANNLIVTAPSGTYRGVINGTTPLVREFLGIPFAEPPTGDRRFLPPAPLQSNSSRVFDATRYPPSCPQWISKIPSVYNQDVTEYTIAGPQSEDCLALSIWAPAQGENLPVIVFNTGGGFVTGGIEVNYQVPYHWVQRTQAHIVVTVNYRVNIFGFPNAAGLDSQNLGFLDQRMALEWVRDNIAPFGGDPSRITLWGQSAGAASVDILNFAYPSDPIAAGFFSESGSALLGIGSLDYSHSNFSFVAAHVGCANVSGNSSAELACMRTVPWSTIETFIGGYQDAGTEPAISFLPIADEKVVFADYVARYASVGPSTRPAIFSTCANEGVALIAYNASGPDQAVADAFTLDTFLCPAANTSRLREIGNRTTYRYLFNGDFANDSPRPWMKAYHASDLPMLFATHQDYTNGKGPSTPFEFQTSMAMEDHLLAFMRDPVNGPRSVGWGSYEEGVALKFGADGKAVQTISIADLDAPCKAS